LSLWKNSTCIIIEYLRVRVRNRSILKLMMVSVETWKSVSRNRIILDYILPTCSWLRVFTFFSLGDIHRFSWNGAFLRFNYQRQMNTRMRYSKSNCFHSHMLNSVPVDAKVCGHALMSVNNISGNISNFGLWHSTFLLFTFMFETIHNVQLWDVIFIKVMIWSGLT
jgi:hypothetical protein